MKTTPLIFNADSIRAMLDGRKSQTRRIVKPQPNEDRWKSWVVPEARPYFQTDEHGKVVMTHAIFHHQSDGLPLVAWRCPYGQPGDLIWCRETWGVGCRPDPYQGWRDGLEYRADESFLQHDCDLLPLHFVTPPEGVDLDEYASGWKSPTQMPRWASRLTLRLTAVRVQRVQEISESDCYAEGIEAWLEHDENLPRYADGTPNKYNNIRQAYAYWWNSINAKRGYPLADNPWVRALTYDVIHANVDDVLAAPERYGVAA